MRLFNRPEFDRSLVPAKLRVACLVRLHAAQQSAKELTELPLYLTHGKVKDVAVVWVVGRIVLGKETGDLREKVKGLYGEGYKKLLLNMEGVTFVDSAGLGVLVALNCSAKSCGASLRLCHLGAKFKDLMYITKLYTIFEVSDTQADALRDFSA